MLFETQNATGLWIGLTDHYVKVGVRSTENLSNTIRPVVISGVTDGLALGHLADDMLEHSTCVPTSTSPLPLMSKN